MQTTQKSASVNESANVAQVWAKRGHWTQYLELTKPRLSLMSVISAVIGYLAATPARDYPVFFSLLFGTTLAAGGAAALNEWMERDADARMQRTASRPIPAGLITPGTALLWGLALSLAGCTILYFGANPLAGVIGAITVTTYLLAYTPLKKITPWAAEVGGIPGALPPLLGWVAATGSFGWTGWYLFAVLFAWQMTHFFAISWSCREDYSRGGFRTLSYFDTTGTSVANRAVFYAAILFGITLLPVFMGSAGWIYWIACPLLSAWFLAESFRFRVHSPRDTASAKRLFFVSIIYLPLFLLSFVGDRFFS